MIYGKDKLWRKQVTGGTLDAMGDYIPASETWSEPELCDAQSGDVQSGGAKANVTIYANGALIAYTYEVILDVSTSAFKVGDIVRLEACGNPAAEFSVLGFQRYATFCKIWV